MNVRAIFCVVFFFGWIVWTGAFAQTAGIYQKPQVHLGLDWDEHELQQWLMDYLPSLNSTNSSLFLAHNIKSPGGTHLTFEQVYRDQRIHQAGIKVNLGHDGKLYSLMDGLKSFQQPDPSVSSYVMTERLAIEMLKKLTRAYEVHIEKKWWVDQDTLHPVFIGTTFSHEEVVSYEFVIHGQTGRILSQEDRGAYFTMDSDTSGRGRIFVPDPCTVSETAYGTLFTDADDMHLPVFDSFLDTVELKDLTYENGLFHLKGPYVTIEDRAPFNNVPATSATGDFFFTRDQSEFEDVMVYFHIDTFQRYIQHLGFTNLHNRPILADPHGKSNLDNSVFVRNGNSSYLLFGDGGVDDAEDADVIIHEYGHALSYAAAPDTWTGLERKGLDEGIGDYFASSYSQDISNWGWHEVYTWDGHNEFWDGRLSVNSYSYPPPSNNIYAYGELWAATMMQIRNHIGAEITDRIQLQEMYANFAGMTLEDAAMAVIDADSMLYDGVHAEVIADYFCQRNILEQNSCLSVGIEEEQELDSSIEIHPNPSSGEITIQLPTLLLNRSWELKIFDIQGREIRRHPLMSRTSQHMRVLLSDGVYVLTFFADGEVYASEKLIIFGE